MKTVLSVTSGLLIFISVSATAEGCKFDTQCKGDRICEQGICVYPNDESSDPDDSPTIVTTTDGLPHFCCTTVGKFGPYPNPDIQTGLPANEGDSCYGTTAIGQIRYGMACY